MVQECSDLRWGSFSQASRSGHRNPLLAIQSSRPDQLDPVIATSVKATRSRRSIAGQPAAAPLQARLRSISIAAGAVDRCSAVVVNESEVTPADPRQNPATGPAQIRGPSGDYPMALAAEVAGIARRPGRASHFFTPECRQHWLALERPPGCYLSDLLCADRRWRFCLDDSEPAPTRSSCCGAAKSLQAQSPSRGSRAR